MVMRTDLAVADLHDCRSRQGQLDAGREGLAHGPSDYRPALTGNRLLVGQLDTVRDPVPPCEDGVPACHVMRQRRVAEHDVARDQGLQRGLIARLESISDCGTDLGCGARCVPGGRRFAVRIDRPGVALVGEDLLVDDLFPTHGKQGKRRRRVLPIRRVQALVDTNSGSSQHVPLRPAAEHASVPVDALDLFRALRVLVAGVDVPGAGRGVEPGAGDALGAQRRGVPPRDLLSLRSRGRSPARPHLEVQAASPARWTRRRGRRRRRARRARLRGARTAARGQREHAGTSERRRYMADAASGAPYTSHGLASLPMQRLRRAPKTREDRPAGRSHQWLPAGERWPRTSRRRICASRQRQCSVRGG